MVIITLTFVMLYSRLGLPKFVSIRHADSRSIRPVKMLRTNLNIVGRNNVTIAIGPTTGFLVYRKGASKSVLVSTKSDSNGTFVIVFATTGTAFNTDLGLRRNFQLTFFNRSISRTANATTTMRKHHAKSRFGVISVGEVCEIRLSTINA